MHLISALLSVVSVVASLSSLSPSVVSAHAHHAQESSVVGYPASLNVSSARLPDGQCLLDGDTLVDCMSVQGNTLPIALAWPSPTIPYEIDTRIKGSRRTVLMQAMQAWTKKVKGLRFVARRGQSAFLRFQMIEPGQDQYGCWASLGYTGGQSTIWAGTECGLGVFIHETGHILGLSHEHQRSDRDRFISVRFENLADGYAEWWKSYADSQNLSPYDYRSVMHYPGDSGSKNGKYVMVSRDKRYPIWNYGEWVKAPISDADAFSVSRLLKLNRKGMFYFGVSPHNYRTQCPKGFIGRGLRSANEDSVLSLGCQEDEKTAGSIEECELVHGDMCPSGKAVFGMECVDEQCSKLALHCCEPSRPLTDMSAATVASQTWEEGVASVECAKDAAVTGLHCNDETCSDMAVTCTPFQPKINVLEWSRTRFRIQF